MKIDLSQFSKREKDIIKLLVQGKSNKQIAHEFGIASRTVEFHLGNIYAKLGVSSRTEAMRKLLESHLWESTGDTGKSTVNEISEIADTKDEPILQIQEAELHPESWTPQNRLQGIGMFLGKYKVLISIGTLLIAILIVVVSTLREPWRYEREGEYPDEYSVGQMIDRSNASGFKVHGQFGVVCCWPSKPGYVKYNNISIPRIDHLYLKLRYSKYSESSVPIQIYVDDEPRAILKPIDQGDWNNFAWTEPIFLGSVGSGVHSIKFYTDGQVYGVADLDKFVLTAGSP